MTVRTLVVAATPLLAAAPRLGAQEDGRLVEPGLGAGSGAHAAYFGITNTPLGALAPSLARVFGGARGSGVDFRAEFGYLDDDGPVSRRTLALGFDTRAGAATVGITGGYLDYSCDVSDLLEGISDSGFDCKGGVIVGASAAAPVLRAPVGSAGTSRFMLGLEGSIGFGAGDIVRTRFTASDEDASSQTFELRIKGTSYAAALGLPLALPATSGGITFIPHLVPRVAYGHAKLEARANVPALGADFLNAEDGAVRFMLGGGIGVLFNRPGVGLHLGFQRVFAEGAKTLVGAGFSFAPR
jgi:hypothetical protein